MLMRFVLLVGIVLLAPAAHSRDSPGYTFAVVPQQSAKILAQTWVPVLDYLSTATGMKLRFVTAKDIPTFEARLAAGEYDFAYMNPYHFTVFNKAPGYRAIAARVDQPIKGILVVRKDSPIQRLEDLQGLTLAFPSPAAFAASVLPRAHLKRENVRIMNQYVSSHDSVYLNVAKGLFPAGGGVTRTFGNLAPEIRDRLRILWTSDGYTPHAIASHPHISADARQSLKTALIAMSENEEGRKRLKALKIKHGFKASEDSDWDDVRGLNIDLLKPHDEN